MAAQPASCALGRITVFNGPSGGSGGVNIANGLSGALWYGDLGLNDIVKMTTKGITKTYTIPSSSALPEGIAPGAKQADVVYGVVAAGHRNGVRCSARRFH